MEDLNEQIEKLRQNRGQAKRQQEDYDFYRQPYEEETEPIEAAQKVEGVSGAFLFQLILVLVIAIAYLLTATFFVPIGKGVLLQVKDKAENDFVFKDKLYDNVGAFLTYINEQSGISEGTKPTEDEDITPSEPPLVPEISQEEGGSGSFDNTDNTDSSAAGGAFTPVLNNEVPQNATLASVIVNGKFFFPLKAEYSVSSYYGFRDHPSSGKAEFHTAADIATGKGAGIYAVASGTVMQSGVDESLGNFIWIDHGDELYSVYGHCDKLLVKEGQAVIKGMTIARVGSTGDSTGNHLHFGMKKNGIYFDPGYVFDELFNMEGQ